MPIEDLTVMIKGMVAQRLKVTSKGGVFGQECIIAEQHSGLRTDKYVSCVSFVMVVVISRETLFELVESFPAAKRWLERCSKILTLRAAFRKAYAIFRQEQKHISRANNLKGANLLLARATGRLRKSDLLRKSATKLHLTKRRLSTTKGFVERGFYADKSRTNYGNDGAAIFADVMYQRRIKPTPNPPASHPDTISPQVQEEESFNRRHAVTAICCGTYRR